MVFPLIAPLLAGLSTAASAVVSAVASIGPTVAAFAAKVGPTLAQVLTTIKPYIETITKFANTLLQGLDILKVGQSVTDMGERALQAQSQGIKPENFNNLADYQTAINKLNLDPEVSAKRSTAEKLVAGLAISTVALEHKFNAEPGSLNGIWLLHAANPNYFNAERVQGLLSAGRLGGDILAYLDKNLSAGDAEAFEEKIVAAEDNADASLVNRSELYAALDSAQAQWAEIQQSLQQGQ